MQGYHQYGLNLQNEQIFGHFFAPTGVVTGAIRLKIRRKGEHRRNMGRIFGIPMTSVSPEPSTTMVVIGRPDELGQDVHSFRQFAIFLPKEPLGLRGVIL
jgi:hypothetical protein